jgi:glyoxylase-like metal-dependent hydrolase (beta-lactamase superfamily II)
MRGELTHTGAEGVTVHTYTAPSDGWTVNSHIVELSDQLIVIDAQYMMTFAAEVVAFAATPRKPITRLYITHFHPDHLLGAAAFKVPIYALPQVTAKIQVIGDLIAREEHAKYNSVIPDHAERPSQSVVPG